MIKKLFGFGILLLILFLVIGLTFFYGGISGHLLRWRISLDLSNFKLSSFTKDKTSFSKAEKLEAVSGTTKVFIKKAEIQDHKKFIEDKKFLFNSLFLPTTSPYPEVITNIIECPDEFKPKVKTVYNGTIYSLFAGERFNYGICSRDLVKYNSEYGIFDCGTKGVFEIFVFSDNTNKIERIMQSFKC